VSEPGRVEQQARALLPFCAALTSPAVSTSFVQLCLEGYYDGLPFHRIVPGFIAQTGDDSGTGGGGESIYDEGEFEDEFTQVREAAAAGFYLQRADPSSLHSDCASLVVDCSPWLTKAERTRTSPSELYL
jgi:hypothetical protein